MAKTRKKEAPLEKLDSIFLDKTPPHNMDSEVGVIGSMLIDPLICDDMTMLVRSDEFYSQRNQILFRTIQGMQTSGDGINAKLLAIKLEKQGELDTSGGIDYIAEIIRAVPTSAFASHYAKIVREKAVLRELIHASAEILRDAYSPETQPQEIISQAEEKIFAINDRRSSTDASTMESVIYETLQILNMRSEKGGMDGVLTGFADLDEMTAGLHPNELIILAGRPSMGKTAAAMNIADYVAVTQQKPTLIFSLEMAKTELAIRMLCSRGGIDGNKFKGNFLSATDRQQLIKASGELSAAPMFIDDSASRTISEMAAVARRMKRKQGLDLIVIDYLTLVAPDNLNDPRQEQVAKMARRLKILARELSVPILCLAQLNRQAEATKDNRPRLSHLRESGAIEQDADVVMFVHREEIYHTKDVAEKDGLQGQAEIIIAKQRNGPVGTVNLRFAGEYTRFENLATPAQEAYSEFAAHGGGDHF